MAKCRIHLSMCRAHHLGRPRCRRPLPTRRHLRLGWQCHEIEIWTWKGRLIISACRLVQLGPNWPRQGRPGNRAATMVPCRPPVDVSVCAAYETHLPCDPLSIENGFRWRRVPRCPRDGHSARSHSNPMPAQGGRRATDWDLRIAFLAFCATRHRPHPTRLALPWWTLPGD